MSQPVCCRTRLLGLGLALVVALAGCASKEEKIATFLERGQRQAEAGNLDQARLEYLNVLQLDPHHGPAFLRLGKTLAALGRHAQAMDRLRQALEADPALDEARLEMAAILTMARQGEKAMASLDAIRERGRFEPRLSIVTAQAHLDLGQLPEAIATLSGLAAGNNRDRAEIEGLLAIAHKEAGNETAMLEAVAAWRAAAPTDIGPATFLVRLAAERHDPTAARAAVEGFVAASPDREAAALKAAATLEHFGFVAGAKSVLEEAPATPVVLEARARFAVRHQDFAAAAAALDQLLAQAPDNASALVLRIRVHLAQGETAKALSLAEQGLARVSAKEDRERLLLEKALMKEAAGEHPAAQALCQEILAGNQGSLEAHFLLGRLLLAARQPEAAEVHLRQAAVGRPTETEAQILLARSQLFAGKNALALETLDKAHKAQPNDPVLAVELTRLLAGQGQAGRAKAVLGAALEQAPDALALRAARIDLLLGLKDFVAAEQDARHLLETQGQEAAGLLALGRVAEARGQEAEAAAWYRKALPLDPGWLAAITSLTDLETRRGQAEAAIATLQEVIAQRPGHPAPQYLLGLAATAAQRPQVAEAAFRQAIAASPQLGRAYRGLTRLLLVEGRAEEALATARQGYQEE
ncbi:MAG: tetratricopeptide repeat protein, partial [Thermodesulfobacteriota bacterium]